MAIRKNTFLLKRSNIPGNVPASGQILLGELALNTADVILYASGTTSGSIKQIGWDRISKTGDTMTGQLNTPTISATTYLNLQNQNLVTVANVKNYGAVGDGTTNDTTAINLAITSLGVSGGTIYFPQGNYKITSAITLTTKSNIKFVGSGYGSIITTSGFNGRHFDFTDCDSIGLYDLKLVGEGINAVNSIGGIIFRLSVNSNTAYHTFKNLYITDISNSGFVMDTPIITTFENVVVRMSAGSGFYLYNGGTSVTMTACYALTTVEAGFNLSTMTYSTLISCAAEVSGAGYLFNNSKAITLNSCGSESNINRSVDFPGDGYRAINGSVITLIACYDRISVRDEFSDGTSRLDKINFKSDSKSHVTSLAGISASTGGTSGAYLPLSGGTVTGLVQIDNGTQYLGNTLKITRGLQASGNDPDMPISLGYPYLQVGGREWLTDGLYTVGFGWVEGNKPSIEIGMQTTNTDGNVIGDFIIATRTLPNDVTPTIKSKLSPNGDLSLRHGDTFYNDGYRLDVFGNTRIDGIVKATTISATTISATTYLNLPLGITITGGTYSSGTAVFRNNTGGTFNVTGFTTGGGSSLNIISGTTTINFGFTNGLEGDFTSTVITNSNVTSSSIISYRIIPSTDHGESEDSLLEGIILKESDIVDGVGFNLNAYANNGSWGTYNINYKIIN